MTNDMPLTTLVFDFDGTLANSFDAVLRIANRLAPEFGYRAARADELELLRASSPAQLATQLGIRWHHIPRIVSRVRRELRHDIASLGTFAGLPETLTALEARGITMCILTSNARDNVESFLVAHHMQHFALIDSSASLWGKRQRLRWLLKQIERSPFETAYVGDEARDVEATKTLGVRSVAVSWGFSSRELLQSSAPDHLLNHPTELLALPLAGAEERS